VSRINLRRPVSRFRKTGRRCVRARENRDRLREQTCVPAFKRLAPRRLIMSPSTFRHEARGSTSACPAGRRRFSIACWGKTLSILRPERGLTDVPSKARSNWDLLGETLSEWREDKAPRLAAALAYYGAFSLAPLLIVVISIAGFVVGDSQQVRDQVVGQVGYAAGPQTAQVVATLIKNAPAGAGGILAGAIGVAMLLLGATGVFGQLKDALNTIWEVKGERRKGTWGLIRARFLSFTMVVGMSLLLLVSLVISAGISFVNAYFDRLLGDWAVTVQLLDVAVSLAVVTLVFAAIFKIIPDARIAWRDVWAGASITAVLFTIGKEILSLYLARIATSSAYGAAGSLVCILAWLYYSAQILFLGAEFTQVYARRRGSRTGSDTRGYEGAPSAKA